MFHKQIRASVVRQDEKEIICWNNMMQSLAKTDNNDDNKNYKIYR